MDPYDTAPPSRLEDSVTTDAQKESIIVDPTTNGRMKNSVLRYYAKFSTMLTRRRSCRRALCTVDMATLQKSLHINREFPVVQQHQK